MSRKSPERMRDLVLSVGGELRGSENRTAWLARIARSIGESHRTLQAAWWGELRPGHRVEWKLRAAVKTEAEKAGANELAELRNRLARLERALLQTDADFHQPQIDPMRDSVREASGSDSP